MITLYEIQGYNPDTSAEETLRFSTKPYISLRSDTPAQAKYLDYVMEGGTYETFMYDSGTSRGRTRAGSGIIRLANNDGHLDQYFDYSFDNRTIVLRQVERDGAAYPTEIFQTLTIKNVQKNAKDWQFEIADPLAALEVPLCTTEFLGTNGSSTSALEGKVDGLKGSTKPALYGTAFEIPAPLVNDLSLIYGVNFDADGNPAAVASIDEVYDAGLALIASGTNHANETALAGATIAAGEYDTCIAKGLFRLGSTPAGKVTADATEKASSSDMTIAQTVKRIITDRTEFVAGDFDSAAITALDTANSAVVGAWIKDSGLTVLDVISDILASDNAYLVVKRDGTLVLGRLTDPSGATAVGTIKDWQSVEDNGGVDTLYSGEENGGIPPWKIRGNYKKIYSVQNRSELAASVTSEREVYLANEYRGVTAEDSSVLDAHKSSKPYDHYMAFYDVTAAQTATNRQLALHGVDRVRWLIPTEASTEFDVGDVVEVDLPIYDLRGGKNLTIMGQVFNQDRNLIQYEMWG